jgi:hypothetical protein
VDALGISAVELVPVAMVLIGSRRVIDRQG